MEEKGDEPPSEGEEGAELTLDTLFVRRDGGALDADAVLEDCVRRVDSHLVIGGVTVRQTEVIVQHFHVQVREDQLRHEGKENEEQEAENEK